MRPSGAATEKESNMVVILTKFNYEAWEEDVENRCLRKGKAEEGTKIAFLRQGLSTKDKNQLRRAMKKEIAKVKADRKTYNKADPEDAPYTWALGYIRDKIIRLGQTEKEREELGERLKLDLGHLSIRECGFNLQKYFNRFHSMVEQIDAIGLEVEENVLSMYFQNGCLAHRDLKHLTQDEDKRRDKTYMELYQEYNSSLDRLGAQSRGNKKDERPPKKGKGKSWASKFKGKCRHCDKVGQKEADCWEKHPEKKPDRANNQGKSRATTINDCTVSA